MHGNMLSSLGEMAIGSIQPDWGAILLLLGTLATFFALYRAGALKRDLPKAIGALQQ
jgi:hypothetical protein